MEAAMKSRYIVMRRNDALRTADFSESQNLTGAAAGPAGAASRRNTPGQAPKIRISTPQMAPTTMAPRWPAPNQPFSTSQKLQLLASVPTLAKKLRKPIKEVRSS